MAIVAWAVLFLTLLVGATGFDVIGAGLRHTGCDELSEALNILGYNSYHSGKELPNTHPSWTQVMKSMEKLKDEQSESGKTLKASDLKDLYRFSDRVLKSGHKAIVSSPAAFYSLELLRRYPRAKVVLTVQEDSKKWFYEMMKGAQIALHRDMVQAEYHKMDDCALPPADADMPECIQSYQSHNSAVRSTVPPKQFLEFKVEDGWQPLCEFLGRPVPQVPFPGKKNEGGIPAIAMWALIGLALFIGALLVALAMTPSQPPNTPLKKKA
jgi:hypothetical protein